MKVGDFLKVMVIGTFMAVLYIHLQVNIYSLGYQGKSREQKFEKLAEANVIMRNDILRLRSSDHIGRKLLVKEKDYRFAGKSQVVEVEARDGAGNVGLAINKGGEAFGKFMTLAFTPSQGGLVK